MTSQDKAVALSDKDLAERLKASVKVEDECLDCQQIVSVDDYPYHNGDHSFHEILTITHPIVFKEVVAALEAREAEEKRAMKRLRAKVESWKNELVKSLPSEDSKDRMVILPTRGAIRAFESVLAEIDGDSNSSTGEEAK